MTVDWKPAAESLATDLRRVFGDRLKSVVAYGPHLDGDDHAPLTCLALVGSLTADDLQACATNTSKWNRAQVATPLILPEQEFRRSLDAFPVEYQAILDRHVVIAGRDPFVGCEINREDLRRACEVQARSHLIHLRQGWIEALQAGRNPFDAATLEELQQERGLKPLPGLETPLSQTSP